MRGRRAMAQTAAAIEPAQPSGAPGMRTRRTDKRRRERRPRRRQTAARAERRQPQPQSSHDTARNRPIAVASVASAGHSRSQKIVQRARRKRRASIEAASGAAAMLPGRGLGKAASVTTLSAGQNAADNTLT